MPRAHITSELPCFVIYCDESCHDLTAHHKFMAIGGLKVPRTEKAHLSRELKNLMKSRNLNSELKWSKVSAKRLEDYKKIVDFFFQHTELTFRAIVVEQAKVKMDLHGKDKELAFYKFYYEMLEKWLWLGNEYLILLDYKNNRGADRYMALRTCLQNYFGVKARIRDLTIINSKQTPLAQLCDILTGSIAAANNGFEKHTAKEQLVNHIASSAGLSTLCTSTLPPPFAEKFNIFKPDLR